MIIIIDNDDEDYEDDDNADGNYIIKEEALPLLTSHPKENQWKIDK